MSAKWMGYFFDDSDLEGSELLLALAIADHADSDGKCFPGVDLLAKKIRLKERQTQVLMSRLEQKGYVEIKRSRGRGIMTGFQLIKAQKNAPFVDEKRCTTVPQKVQPNAPLSKDKRCIPAQIKGAFSQQEKVHSGDIPLYKEEPSLTTDEPLKKNTNSTEGNVTCVNESPAPASQPLSFPEIKVTRQELLMTNDAFLAKMRSDFAHLTNFDKTIKNCERWYLKNKNALPNKLDIKDWLAKDYGEISVLGDLPPPVSVADKLKKAAEFDSQQVRLKPNGEVWNGGKQNGKTAN